MDVIIRNAEKRKIESSNVEWFTITAYCPCLKCCGKSDGITATETKAIEGRTIAVDPSVISYGTKVIIDETTYIAEDTGVKGKHIDIFFDNHEEALKFGMQTKQVTILNQKK